MSPYLFFVGVGTYDTYRRELTYPSGRTVLLELLVFPHVRAEHAIAAVNEMHDAIMWVHLSTGPEAHVLHAERQALYAAVAEREALKARQCPLVWCNSDTRHHTPLSAQDAARLAALTDELRSLSAAFPKLGYVYTDRTYRQIAMINSYYGGMENRGNTTILASVIVPARITDHEFIYYASVIAHEYYHAINGSEVTGESPFEMWLNEAVTVFIERMRAAALFGQDYMRLRHVRQAFAPHSGPIAQDWTPSAMAIEPLGFNTTHDLISSTTYAKGPEFIGMVSRMLGPDMFMRALDAYYVRFSHKTATTADWIACMEDVSGLELRNMAHGWLRRIGHPTLVLQSAQYDAAQHTYTIRLRQHGHAAHASHAHPGPWVFPVLWALVKDGRDLTSGTLHLDSESAQILVANVAAEPDFVSLGRGWSFFGRLDLAAMDARQLMCQARSDPDVCGRYFAFRRIAAQAKIAAAMDLRAGRLDRPVQADFVELYGSLLFDSSLCPGTRALILDDVRDIEGAPELAGCHDLLSKASRALLQAVWAAYADGVVKLAWDLHGADDKSQQHKTLPHRDLKRVCMQLMESSTGALDLALDLPHGCTAPSAAETAERVQSFARELALTAHYASDAVLGFRTFMRSNAADRLAVRASVRELWGTTAEGFEQYLSVITSLDSPDAVQIVRDTLNNDPLVNLKLAGHARYFARGWVSVPHRSIQTDDGLELLVEIFVRVALINAFSALPMLDAFGDLAKLEAAPQARLVAALRLMQAPLCADKHVSLWRRIDDLLGCVGAKTDRPQ